MRIQDLQAVHQLDVLRIDGARALLVDPDGVGLGLGGLEGQRDGLLELQAPGQVQPLGGGGRVDRLVLLHRLGPRPHQRIQPACQQQARPRQQVQQLPHRRTARKLRWQCRLQNGLIHRLQIRLRASPRLHLQPLRIGLPARSCPSRAPSAIIPRCKNPYSLWPCSTPDSFGGVPHSPW